MLICAVAIAATAAILSRAIVYVQRQIEFNRRLNAHIERIAKEREARKAKADKLASALKFNPTNTP
jgi:hypothetical protein